MFLFHISDASLFKISGTVRRFLEKFGDDIDLIVFVITGNDRVSISLIYFSCFSCVLIVFS